MLMKEMYPKKFVVPADIPKTVVWTVDRVEYATMPNGDVKPVVFFEEEEKGVIANVTNCTVVALEHGDDTDKWIGKKLEIHTPPVTFNNVTKPAIRFRIPTGPNDDIPQ